jgi:hypothetical protein
MLSTRKILAALLAIGWAGLLAHGSALAQSSPNLLPGQVPTAAQWNFYFTQKQDVLGYSPIRKAGDVMLGLLRFSMTAPSLSGCGTGPSIRGNNQSGEVTMGTGSPTGCTITFAASNPYSAVPNCVVSWQANIASMQYAITQSALVLTQTGTSSNKINYFCTGLQ